MLQRVDRREFLALLAVVPFWSPAALGQEKLAHFEEAHLRRMGIDEELIQLLVADYGPNFSFPVSRLDGLIKEQITAENKLARYLGCMVARGMFPPPDLSGHDFSTLSEDYLSGFDLRWCNIRGTNWKGRKLRDLNLYAAEVDGTTDFDDCEFTGDSTLEYLGTPKLARVKYGKNVRRVR